MKVPKPVLRILIVEDDPVRAAKLRELMPEDVRVVHVASAGVVIGTNIRDRGRVYAGVLLDHDLQQQTKVAADRDRDGRDVALAIATHFDNEIPVLVHSMNPEQSPELMRILEVAGFDVTRIRMSMLSPEAIAPWLAEVRESFEDSLE